MDNKSVTRRILAIIITVCGVGIMAWLAFNGSEGAQASLATLVTAVVAFYFGAKSSSLE